MGKEKMDGHKREACFVSPEAAVMLLASTTMVGVEVVCDDY